MYRLLWFPVFFFACEAEEPKVIEGEIIDIDEHKTTAQNDADEQPEEQQEMAPKYQSIDIHIDQQDDWKTGTCYLINIFNPQNRNIEWQANISLQGHVSEVRNAELIEQNQTTATFVGADFNYDLAPDENVQFHFCLDQ